MVLNVLLSQLVFYSALDAPIRNAGCRLRFSKPVAREGGLLILLDTLVLRQPLLGDYAML